MLSSSAGCGRNERKKEECGRGIPPVVKKRTSARPKADGPMRGPPPRNAAGGPGRSRLPGGRIGIRRALPPSRGVPALRRDRAWRESSNCSSSTHTCKT